MITVKRAYLELEREGVIVTQQGKGRWSLTNPRSGAELYEQDLAKHIDRIAQLVGLLGSRLRNLLPGFGTPPSG